MKPSAVRIVLVEPENPGNVGAVARSMANTGLSDLRLVSPGDWRTVEAWRMGWHAEDILEQARVFDTLDSALEGSTYVAGLSGRGVGRVPPITVRQMAGRLAELGVDDIVSLVFGCEANGLAERDLLACHQRVRIPSHPSQPSLNLAQAVMVAAYEVFLSIGDPRPDQPDTEAIERAPVEQTEPALVALRNAMVSLRFLSHQNPETRFSEWRDMFGRSGIRRREVKLMLALARRMEGAARIVERAKRLGLHRETAGAGDAPDKPDRPDRPDKIGRG